MMFCFPIKYTLVYMDANSRAGTARVEAAIRHKSRSRPTFICSRSPSPSISSLVSGSPNRSKHYAY